MLVYLSRCLSPKIFPNWNTSLLRQNFFLFTHSSPQILLHKNYSQSMEMFVISLYFILIHYVFFLSSITSTTFMSQPAPPTNSSAVFMAAASNSTSGRSLIDYSDLEILSNSPAVPPELTAAAVSSQVR